MTLNSFNNSGKSDVAKLLFNCCGSDAWVKQVMEAFPFVSEMELVAVSGKVWYEGCNETDWRQSFTHHPKIGDLRSLAEKFASTQHLAVNEQASVNTASQNLIHELAHA